MDIAVLEALDSGIHINLSPLADVGDLVGITKKINGGTDGLSDRIKFILKGKNCLRNKLIMNCCQSR